MIGTPSVLGFAGLVRLSYLSGLVLTLAWNAYRTPL